MFIKRKLNQVVTSSSKIFSILMLTGPRQAGKTTLLRHLEPNRLFITLDDLEQRTLAKENPQIFVERNPSPCLIDEFQYAPQLLPYLKITVDQKRTQMLPSEGDFWLTGSQNFTMMEEVQESLAGRVVILKLLGLSWEEIKGDLVKLSRPSFFKRPLENFKEEKKLEDLFAIILKGDKPEVWAKEDLSTSQYYLSYIQTYLERDVRSQLGVKELGLFEKFMRLLAARTGQLLNMSNLAADVGVKVPTIKSWLTILERSFQIYLLQPYYKNLSNRQVKTPKIYFLDTGLVAHLLKWNEPKQALAGQMAGPLFENWVFAEIIKSYWHNGEEPNLYFWRTRDGLEIDLVEESGDTLHLAEVKLSERPDREFFKPIDKLEKIKLGLKRIITPAKQHYPLDSQTEVFSAWDI